MFSGIFRNESEFRSAFGKYVTRWIAGDLNKALLLFNSLAEEDSFFLESDGSLSMGGFGGMNAPHQAVLGLFNRFFQGCSVDSSGGLHGTAKIKVDCGSNENKIEVTIDFDKGTISPPLNLVSPQFKKNGRPVGGPISFSDLMKFFEVYLKKDEKGEALFIKTASGEFAVNPKRAEESAMNVFMFSLDIDTIKHEFFHALYDNNSEYKEKVLALVRKSSQEQREAAVLAAACAYDVFDPDAPAVTRDIVIDEMYNAYSIEERFNFLSMRGDPMVFNAERFCAKYSLKETILKGYRSIDELPISSGEKLELRKILSRQNFAKVTEEKLLLDFPGTVLSAITDMSSLRNLLMKNEPEFYQKAVSARKQLVDWADNP